MISNEEDLSLAPRKHAQAWEREKTETRDFPVLAIRRCCKNEDERPGEHAERREDRVCAFFPFPPWRLSQFLNYFPTDRQLAEFRRLRKVCVYFSVGLYMMTNIINADKWSAFFLFQQVKHWVESVVYWAENIFLAGWRITILCHKAFLAEPLLSFGWKIGPFKGRCIFEDGSTGGKFWWSLLSGHLRLFRYGLNDNWRHPTEVFKTT